jgi:CheY-like chemotaxis protein
MGVSIPAVDYEPCEVRQGTYVMHFAGSGEAALERLSGDIEPALIAVLSDIKMPGMDSLQ